MNKIHHAIAPHVREEIQRARQAEKSADAQRAFSHLERPRPRSGVNRSSRVRALPDAWLGRASQIL